jgi:hypothetical protein
MAVLPKLGGVAGVYKQAGTSYSPLWERTSTPNEWQSCDTVEYQEQSLLGTRPVVIVSASFHRKTSLTDALAAGANKDEVLYISNSKGFSGKIDGRPVHPPVATWIKDQTDNGFVVCSVTKHFDSVVEELAWDYIVY